MAATHYSESLRTIGQALEARDISAFELKWLAGLYVINGTPEPPKSFNSKLCHWLRKKRGNTENDPIIFQIADVIRLSAAGRANRSTPGGVTEFRNLSNLLRTIGAYLDSNEFELVALQKRAISITLFYLDEEGEEQQEDRSISSFYEDFLELCGRRASKYGV